MRVLTLDAQGRKYIPLPMCVIWKSLADSQRWDVLLDMAYDLNLKLEDRGFIWEGDEGSILIEFPLEGEALGGTLTIEITRGVCHHKHILRPLKKRLHWLKLPEAIREAWDSCQP